VLHQIAAGTLGPVFRAYQPELDKLVAVKLFRLNLPPERVHQLAAALESLVGADLTHPAIATPIAAGMSGASAYLVQDFVAADSLDIVIRDHGAAPPADAVRIATQLAGALDFAAVVHVHHGALHPRDVLVTSDETRLGSLGLAAILERIGVATPVRRPYTAPERIAGAPWDRRADVFSLAAITAELLWGRRLTATGEEAARGLTELPGSDLALLQQVFARALADDPADRFPTALEFAEALRNAISVEPIEAPPPFESASLPFDDLEPPPPPAPSLPLEVRESTPSVQETAFDVAPHEVAIDAAPLPAVAPDTIAGPHGDPLPLAAGGHPAHRAPGADPARSAIWPLALALVIGVALGAGAAIMVLSGRGEGGEAERAAAASPAVAVPDPAASAPRPAPATTPSPPEPAPRMPPADPAPSAALGASTPPGNPRPSAPQAATTAAPPPATAGAPPPRTPSPPPAPKPSGRLLVRSSPSGARAFLDGRSIGVTPATISGLRPGTYSVRVTSDGFVEARQRVVISRERPSQSLTVELVRNAQTQAQAPPAPRQRTNGRYVASLRVETRPAGARVFLDGRLVGTSPMVLNEVSVGEHAIRFELPDHRPWTASVRVVAGEPNRIAASLDSN
jgi:serine/threonine-protein kinase